MSTRGTKKCRLHGGASTKGDRWLNQTFTKRRRSSAETVERYLRDKKANQLEYVRQRAERLAAMTPDERAQAEKRAAQFRKGSKAERERRKVERSMRVDVKALLAERGMVDNAADTDGPATPSKTFSIFD